MCGRYVSPEQAAIERAWNIGQCDGNPFAARYNVAPQQGNPANYKRYMLCHWSWSIGGE